MNHLSVLRIIFTLTMINLVLLKELRESVGGIVTNNLRDQFMKILIGLREYSRVRKRNNKRNICKIYWSLLNSS